MVEYVAGPENGTLSWTERFWITVSLAVLYATLLAAIEMQGLRRRFLNIVDGSSKVDSKGEVRSTGGRSEVDRREQ